MDETVRRLLSEIGQDPNAMKKKDLKFAQKFINNWNDGEQNQPTKPFYDFNNFNSNNNNVVNHVVNYRQQQVLIFKQCF